MREAPEPPNNVGVEFDPFERVGIARCARECHAALLIGEFLRVLKGQVAKSAERSFFYLPFEHSEELADQERCVALARATGDADTLKWAELHADIIRRFGRFPHRNAVLGRASTAAEQAFLDGGGFSG